jgi:transposase InsO family protein
MVNAVRVLADLITVLPPERTPETTEHRQGYLHPINVGGNRNLLTWNTLQNPGMGGNLFIFRGIPEHIRSDNGPEFTAKAVRRWLNRLGIKNPLY